MHNGVTRYIDKGLPWQIEVCEKLRELVRQTIPDVEEKLEYGKPHFLKNDQHAAVLHVARNKVSFMVFNAADVDPVKGVLRSLGNGDRKTVDISEDQDVDYGLVADILARTSSTL
ncbi:uncharacterized protein DUF1801 [Kribbella steppae]|uniref:Uncharacterized protein DUF1801 n=1 Tax=Kribbella steppae TaxID=2512223 RepID=A0A4R2HGM0_9ACTN|nr:DUF1801 domain-containing protein [Kribbella steppae]TCO28313.1 uncharacterized protein DUF1801 [Kribbella steppae]